MVAEDSDNPSAFRSLKYFVKGSNLNFIKGKQSLKTGQPDFISECDIRESFDINEYPNIFS